MWHVLRGRLWRLQQRVASLPHNPAASRVALLVGGSAAVIFGGMAAVTRFLG